MTAAHPVPLSVLDLAPIPEGFTPSDALDNSRELAAAVERLGYQRFWMAEHHNMPGIASAATAVALCHVGNATSTIRIGAGGVMLPNHAPLVIAEQFGTLAALFPDRVDLGLGRAPGTDPHTAHALRRTLQGDVDDFPRDVAELQAYFAKPAPGQVVQAVPGSGSQVPLWILGSSLYGAQLAAYMGLPYAFASHFAPQALHPAIDLYRKQFRPSEQLEEPYVMLGFNAVVAASDDEAHWLRTSGLQAVLNLRRGRPSLLPRPKENFDESLSAADAGAIRGFQSRSAVGTAERVARELRAFVDETQADEIIVVSQIWDPHARCESYRLLAEEWPLVAR